MKCVYLGIHYVDTHVPILEHALAPGGDLVILQSTTRKATNSLSLPPGFTHMNINLILTVYGYTTLLWSSYTDSDMDAHCSQVPIVY